MKVRFLVSFILFSNIAFAQIADREYFRSPLNIPIVLSGNFGELRSNHFHSGIDIKTEGRTGLPVYAAAQGEVSRIRIGPFGFGLALYIDHPNGQTTVYGHLEKFRDDIQEYARKNQYKQESFDVDLTVPQGTFSIKKGEQIAWSGNTGGSGGPHLHFEIRNTKSQHPINPLLFDLPIKDEMKPKILSAMIYPLSDDALVDGSNNERLIETVFYNGAYHLKSNPIVPVYGDIGFGLQTIDYLDGSWSKCGIYEIKLAVDEKPVYTFLMNELDFDETRYINSHIDYGYYRTHYKRIHKSWVEPGNKLNNYPVLIDRGIVNLTDEKVHNIRYEIQDAYGNASALEFKVQSKKGNAAPTKQTGRLIPFDENTDVIKPGLKAHFKNGTFYSNFHLQYEERPANNLYFSKLYQLHNDQVPVQQSYELSIRADELPAKLRSKALLAVVNEKNGRKWSMGGSYDKGWVTANVRQLGIFAISVDTIAPTIQPLSISGHNRLTEPSRIRFKIKDDFSGIDSYRGEIDGAWVLFEYDAKNDLITYDFDSKRLQAGKNHQLVLKVTDNKGNEAQYEATFAH